MKINKSDTMRWHTGGLVFLNKEIGFGVAGKGACREADLSVVNRFRAEERHKIIMKRTGRSVGLRANIRYIGGGGNTYQKL